MFLTFFKLKLLPPTSALQAQRGFTLVEMMVVIAIFVITTGIVLANLPAFRDKSSLDLVAQEVATVIRQAQVFGAGTRQTLLSGNKAFPSYGVLVPTVAGGTKFFLFADTNGNGLYNGSTSSCDDECAEQYNFTGGVTIKKAVYFSSSMTCGSGAGVPVSGAGGLGIIFKRPSNLAGFYNYLGSQPQSAVRDAICVGVVLKSAQGQCKQIIVWPTGHIYVDPNPVTPC